jgi:thiamine-phosphate pyrophosphorylase
MAILSSAEAGLKAAPRATVLQLRAPGLSTAGLEREATRLVAAARIPVLISSRCDVALAAGAAGVNLPERDISTRDARKLMGDRLVGRSVHTRQAGWIAQNEGADFVIFGPIWPSRSHPGTAAVGLDALDDIIDALLIPVYAIGGLVLPERIQEVLAMGAAGYASIGYFA